MSKPSYLKRAENPPLFMVKSSGSTASQTSSGLQDIRVPFTPALQAMFARKTRTFDMNMESKMRESVLKLSVAIDDLDVRFIKEMYKRIRDVDPAIYEELLKQPHQISSIIDPTASSVDLSMSHLDLWQAVQIRGDQQREAMLNDLLLRLESLAYAPTSNVNLEKVNMLIMELLARKKQLSVDEYYNRKVQLLQSCQSTLVSMKKGQLTSLTQKPAFVWPQINIKDEPEAIKVKIHVPGMKKDDVYIDATNEGTVLVVSGTREAEEEQETLLQQEIPTGDFTREIELPCKVDPSQIQAEFVEGVLDVSIPKQQ